MSPCLRAVGIALLALGTVLGAALFDPGPAPLAAQDGAAGLGGRLLYLDGGAIWALALPSGDRQPFLQLAAGVITHVAHSPDRQRLAYSVLHLAPGYQILGSDIVVAGADGSDPRTVVHQEGAATSLGWPAWSGDGAQLVYSATDLGSGVQQLEEIDLRSSARASVLEGGSSPSPSPDGQWLVYSYSTDRGWGIGSLHRPSGTRREVVSDTSFVDSDVPSFSPDGQVVAFVAAGPGPASRGEHLLPGLTGLLQRALIPAAQAHEIDEPFDLWSIRPDGSGLARVALLKNLQPYLAWSPDGRHLAVWGGSGLQVVDTATGGVRWLSPVAGTGPISWGY